MEKQHPHSSGSCKQKITPLDQIVPNAASCRTQSMHTEGMDEATNYRPNRTKSPALLNVH